MYLLKTVGFLLPAFQAMLPLLPIKPGQGPLGLVMAPVRELAQQIQVEAERFGAVVGVIEDGGSVGASDGASVVVDSATSAEKDGLFQSHSPGSPTHWIHVGVCKVA